jgi:hypothetical protein
MNADGINYLDIGDAYMRGDLDAAINSVWSPLYSWILGAVMSIVRPSMNWEFPVVHIVNFFIYIGALFAFEFLWRQMVQYRHELSSSEQTRGLPEWALWSAGYLLFIVASLQLIELWAVTPDMLMSIFVYLGAGLIVRVRVRGVSVARYALLGVILGFGYLAKSIMFPMAFAFLVIAGLGAESIRKSLVPTLVAVVTFVTIAAPFVYLISQQRGEFTFGDAGKITYVRYLNDLPYPHWQGGSEGSGAPVHPTRVVFENPSIYEFAEPVAGTYPVSYDPWYWYEGAQIHVDLSKQIGYLVYSVWYYATVMVGPLGPLTFGLAVLIFLFGFKFGSFADGLRRWGVALVGLGGLALYSTVHVIGRYVGAFFVLVFVDVLAHVRTGDSEHDLRTANRISMATTMLMLAGIGIFNLEGALTLSGQRSPHAGESVVAPAPGAIAVATKLGEIGLAAGAYVAIIGDGFTADWARLARIRIVAQMPASEASLFWSSDDDTRRAAVQAFADAGALAVVAERVAGHAPTEGWLQVGSSSSYIRILDDQAGPTRPREKSQDAVHRQEEPSSGK